MFRNVSLRAPSYALDPTAFAAHELGRKRRVGVNFTWHETSTPTHRSPYFCPYPPPWPAQPLAGATWIARESDNSI